MNGRVRFLLVLGALAAAAACAAPRASVTPPAPAQASPAAPLAGLPESFALVKDYPGVAAASRNLAAAPLAAQPGLLAARAREAIAAAQKIRSEQGNEITLQAQAPGYQQFLAFYDLAYSDLDRLLALFPVAAEAAEAQYLMGLIHDYRHLDNFDEALRQYHLTVDLHPGTVWAQKASERIRRLEALLEGSQDSPHGQ